MCVCVLDRKRSQYYFKYIILDSVILMSAKASSTSVASADSAAFTLFVNYLISILRAI